MQRCKRAVNTVIKTWCPLSRDDRTFIVTDSARLIVAEALCGLCKELGCDTGGICVFRRKKPSIRWQTFHLNCQTLAYGCSLRAALRSLLFRRERSCRIFPALRRPEWLRSRYIFFRSRIPERALLETDRIAMEYALYASGDRLNVEAPGGTDIDATLPGANCFGRDFSQRRYSS